MDKRPNYTLLKRTKKKKKQSGKHRRRFSIFLSLEKMQIKTTFEIPAHFVCNGYHQIKKIKEIKGW